jgi:D-psicose/D-tagatose/L-ribulose 3-epimerase
MKLAASNIAWDPDEDDVVASILRERGFTGVEIAPSKRWESPTDATNSEIASYRNEWAERGLKIIAMQALLYGRPDLQLFGSEIVRRELRGYLTLLIEMAHGLGADALVFGAPRNRKRGGMPLEEATNIAVDFFRDVGAIASARSCVICIEPNPTSYDCDFITTTEEAVAFCERIASRSVKVNGDVGSMVTNREDPAVTVLSVLPWLGHFHASEPALVEITDGIHQRKAAATLRQHDYAGWVSVEMRGGGIEGIKRAADRVLEVYRGESPD